MILWEVWSFRAITTTITTTVKMAISVQDLVESCGLELACLDREVTYEDFHEISHCLTQWQPLAPKLIQDNTKAKAAVEAIESEHSSAVKQKIAFLDTWKERMAFKATYRVLVDALLSIGKAESARKVCKTLTGKHDTISTGFISFISVHIRLGLAWSPCICIPYLCRICHNLLPGC